MLTEKRTWLPFVILTVIIVIIVSILLISKYLPKGSQYPLVPLGGCVVMQDREDYEHSVDVVFLADNYDSLEEFIADTGIFADALIEVYPYNEYADRFNFFRIEDFKNLGCTHDEAIICNPPTVKMVGSICPHDYFVVLSDVDGIKNLFKFLRSSSWMGVNAINTADNKLVLAHEFAHAFGDFADEYEFDGVINWDAPNCDSDWQTCPKFQVVDDYECWRGCVNDKNSRSVEVGIMRDYWSSSTYGSFNEYYLKKLLEENTVAAPSEGVRLHSPVYFVHGKCEGDSCSITYVEEGDGFADSYYSDGFLSVKNGANLASLKSSLLFTDYGPDGGAQKVEEYDFLIIVDQDPVDKKVDLIGESGILDTYRVDQEGVRIFGPSKKRFF